MDGQLGTTHLELAAHRVLRGELSPWIHAVTAEISADRVTLRIYHHHAPDGWQAEFESTIESEWDQVIAALGAGGVPSLELCFQPAETFTEPGVEPRLLYVSPWSGPIF